MDEKNKIVAACLIIFAMIIIVITRYWNNEQFTTKREKANAIFSWFNKHGDNSSYKKYRSALDSNIVEYSDVIKLFRDRNLTINSIESIL